MDTSIVDGISEEILTQAFIAYPIPLSQSISNIHYSQLSNSRIPTSFKEAVQDNNWCEAIDREYNALRSRHTWSYVTRTPDLNVIPYTWVFRLKPLDNSGCSFLHKARCCIRGDFQNPGIDFDPSNIYAPVASHEAIRTLLAIAAANGLIVEGGDVSNAYLYGDIDVPIFMEQPTDSTGIQ